MFFFISNELMAFFYLASHLSPSSGKGLILTLRSFESLIIKALSSLEATKLIAVPLVLYLPALPTL